MTDRESFQLDLQKVLFATDLSGEETSAFAHALRIGLAAHSEFHLLHFEPDLRVLDWEEFPHVRATIQAWKTVYREGLEQSHIYVQKAFETGKDAVSAIVDYIVDREIGLAVLATHQRKGVDRLLHASISEPIARKTNASTLFVPNAVPGFVSATSGRVHLSTVLIPVAIQPIAGAAVEAVLELLTLLGCADVRVVLLFVGPRAEFPLLDVSESEQCIVERVCRQGDVVKEIVDCADEIHADLVAMVTEGHVSLIDTLTGDTTERVLRQLKCPLLAIRER